MRPGGHPEGMDGDHECREADDSTFERYVRYAFRPTAGGETDPDVSLGVGRLSQLAVGYCDASAMAAADHLDAPPEAVERLDALFPAGSVWLREGF